MTPQQIESWGKSRAKGRTRFVWRMGVVAWGLPTAITWAVVMAAFQGWERLPLLLPIALLLFPIGGYWFGASTWRKYEGLYEQAMRDQPQAE
jgi:hypothetical protein